MEQLKAKLKKQGGFTMVELLIVVAIIAILVAVSIPMMNNALEKSRHAVDRANIRDAIALASVEYMADVKNFPAAGKIYSYVVDPNTHKGYLIEGNSGGVSCECTCDGRAGYPLYVKVTPPTTTGLGPDATPTIEVSWETDAATGKTIDGPI